MNQCDSLGDDSSAEWGTPNYLYSIDNKKYICYRKESHRNTFS